MKPTTLTRVLRVAILASAPMLFGSPVLLHAADTTAASAPARATAQPDMPPPPPPGSFDENDGNDPNLPPGMQRPPRHRPDGMTDEMAALEKFLDMSPEQLAMIRNLIGRIEQMSAEEKEELRSRIRNLREMDSERRQKLMDMHRQIPWEERMILHQYWRSLPDEERKQLWEEMKDLSPEERLAHKQQILEKARAAGFDESTLPPPPASRPDFPRRKGPQDSEATGDDAPLPPQ